jgi:hypothetical protein
MGRNYQLFRGLIDMKIVLESRTYADDNNKYAASATGLGEGRFTAAAPTKLRPMRDLAEIIFTALRLEVEKEAGENSETGEEIDDILEDFEDKSWE